MLTVLAQFLFKFNGKLVELLFGERPVQSTVRRYFLGQFI